MPTDSSDEETTYAEIEAAIATDALEGIQTFTDGDQSVTMMDLEKRLKIAERLRLDEVATSNARFGIRISKMISPGAWS